MNVSVLINSILQQTTVLVAELATSHGLRAPLAHVADQVFLELARELETQGLSRKVTADMFGLALRTYQRKVQRLQESGTERGRTLSEAVYDFVRSRAVASRPEILDHFRDDDEALVRAVLTDLVETRIVFATGPSQNTSFRAATDDELRAMRRTEGGDADEMVWALVFRTGPATATSLAAMGRIGLEQLEPSLERLIETGRIAREERATQEGSVYRTPTFVVPLGAESGWEAAVFDHFHAVVTTVCAKLHQMTARSSLDDRIGGSTYSFELWSDHPLAEEVVGFLQRFRTEYSRLRERVKDYNAKHPKPLRRQGVVVYGGQSVWELDSEDACFVGSCEPDHLYRVPKIGGQTTPIGSAGRDRAGRIASVSSGLLWGSLLLPADAPSPTALIQTPPGDGVTGVAGDDRALFLGVYNAGRVYRFDRTPSR